MSENKIIYMPHGRLPDGVLIERLVFIPEFIRHILGKTAVLRPALPKAECKPRMQETEHYLQKTIVESPTHKFVPMHAFAQTVSVTEKECLPCNFNNVRLLYYLHTHILKIMVAPYIMVTREEVDFHTGLHQFNQSGKNQHIAFWNDIVIFVPEIPYIPEKVKRLRLILRHRVQETHKTLFASLHILDIQAEMHIRNEVRENALCHIMLKSI